MASRTKVLVDQSDQPEHVGVTLDTNGHVVKNENGPPYEANWLTIKAAAVRAEVSGQSIRKAIEKFSTIFADKTFSAAPRDMFGNEIGRAIEYVDAAAIDAWLAAKAEMPSRRGGRRANDGTHSYTVRLTDNQFEALRLYVADGAILETVSLFGVAFKRNERKLKNSLQSTASTNNDLFDVDVAS